MRCQCHLWSQLRAILPQNGHGEAPVEKNRDMDCVVSVTYGHRYAQFSQKMGTALRKLKCEGEVEGDRHLIVSHIFTLTLTSPSPITLTLKLTSAERSFSLLKLIKIDLQNRTSDERLSDLTVLSIHKSITQQLNIEDIIDEFAKSKRKLNFINQLT